MHIVCTPAALAKPLARCAAITNPRSPHTMAQNVLLDAKKKGLYIHTTDFDRLLVERVADVETSEYGTVCVAAKTLADFVGLMPKDAQLTLALRDDGRLGLESSVSHSVVATYNADLYPKIQPFARAHAFPLDAHLLERMVRLCDWCISEYDLRELEGAYIEAVDGRLMMTSTDRQVLVHVEADDVVAPELAFAEIAHRKAVERFAPMAAAARQVAEGAVIEMAVTENRVMLKSDDAYFAGPLVEAEYIPYRKLLPQDWELNRSMKCNREQLLSAVRQAKLFGSEEQWSVVLSFDTGGVTVRGGSVEKGESQHHVPARLAGDLKNVRIAFNPDFFINGLRHLPTDEVYLEFADAIRKGEVVDRALVRTEIEGIRWQYLMMSTSLPGE